MVVCSGETRLQSPTVLLPIYVMIEDRSEMGRPCAAGVYWIIGTVSGETRLERTLLLR